jgi:hypothetical protein
MAIPSREAGVSDRKPIPRCPVCGEPPWEIEIVEVPSSDMWRRFENLYTCLNAEREDHLAGRTERCGNPICTGGPISSIVHDDGSVIRECTQCGWCRLTTYYEPVERPD